jgi:hypothetical protein
MAILAGALHGQTPRDLALRCAAAGTPGDVRREAACDWGASAAHAFQSGVGLLMASGGVIPSSPSTAGTRFGGAPRWILDGGTGFVSYTHPDLSSGAAVDAPHVRRTEFAPRITVVRGVFDGFRLLPGVGGIGSVDVVGDRRYRPTTGFSRSDAAVLAYGGGVRLGLLRESFILPGITLSATVRQGGRIGYGTGSDDRPRVDVAPQVASVGAMVGKDLLFIGISAGVQRDWVRGDARVLFPSLEGGIPVRGDERRFDPVTGSIPVERTTWIVGGNWTWIVAQAAFQIGWAERPELPRGWDSLPDFRGGESGFVGGLSFRITY